MHKLVIRMFRKSWLVQAALIIVLASAVTVLMIYGAYIKREGADLAANIESRITDWGTILAVAPEPENSPNASGMYYVSLLASWSESVVQSNVGDIPCAFFNTDPSIHSLGMPGTAYVPLKIALKLGIASGDEISLRQAGVVNSLVAEVYESSFFGLGYDFGDRLLVFTGLPEQSTSFLYRRTSNTVDAAKRNIKQLHPNSQMIDDSIDQDMGSSLINNNYAGVTQAQMSLVIFITIAFLTAKVLSFLDGRRTLAILKATGLKNSEVAAVISAEALLAPVVGVSGGVLTGYGVLHVLTQRGTGLVYTPAIALSAAAWVLPAILLGAVVPSRFAQVATVVELLFQRSIPLFHERVQTIARRFPAIEAYAAQGIHFLKLEMVDGNFDGIVFRKLGDAVKQGEVIAHGTSWWGLKVTEYAAPVDGLVVYFQKETGFIGIGPENMLGWAPEGISPKPRLATASHDS